MNITTKNFCIFIFYIFITSPDILLGSLPHENILGQSKIKKNLLDVQDDRLPLLSEKLMQKTKETKKERILLAGSAGVLAGITTTCLPTITTLLLEKSDHQNRLTETLAAQPIVSSIGIIALCIGGLYGIYTMNKMLNHEEYKSIQDFKREIETIIQAETTARIKGDQTCLQAITATTNDFDEAIESIETTIKKLESDFLKVKSVYSQSQHNLRKASFKMEEMLERSVQIASQSRQEQLPLDTQLNIISIAPSFNNKNNEYCDSDEEKDGERDEAPHVNTDYQALPRPKSMAKIPTNAVPKKDKKHGNLHMFHSLFGGKK